MSRSFGTINSRAEFFGALDTCLAYARSPDFWLPNFGLVVRRQLNAIRAWSAKDRTPLFAERAAIDINRGIYFMREDLREEEPPEFHEKIELTRFTAWYFASWPASDDAARTAFFRGAISAPRVPERSEIERVARVIASALDACRAHEPRPPEEAFKSEKSLARDTMTVTQWVRWVLLPRLEGIVLGAAPIPPSSQLCTFVMDLADDETLWPVLYALGSLDDLFHKPLPSQET
jgi:uncharacterized protein YqcC (DUF446 family)